MSIVSFNVPLFINLKSAIFVKGSLIDGSTTIFKSCISLLLESGISSTAIGTKLIKTAEIYAKEINISTICFHVEKTNTNAFRLYQRLGYEIYKDQETRYLMIKHLE